MLSLTVSTRGSGPVALEFEHSLLSLSKWEEKYRRPFMSMAEKTPEQMLEYYRMMLTTPEADPDLVYALSFEHMEELTEYINEVPGATVPPPKDPETRRFTGEVLTAEIIYAQMTILRIPWDPAQTWHVNRLMTLIAWAAYKQSPPKEEKRGNAWQRWSDINERNKKFFGSNG